MRYGGWIPPPLLRFATAAGTVARRARLQNAMTKAKLKLSTAPADGRKRPIRKEWSGSEVATWNG